MLATSSSSCSGTRRSPFGGRLAWGMPTTVDVAGFSTIGEAADHFRSAECTLPPHCKMSKYVLKKVDDDYRIQDADGDEGESFLVAFDELPLTFSEVSWLGQRAAAAETGADRLLQDLHREIAEHCRTKDMLQTLQETSKPAPRNPNRHHNALREENLLLKKHIRDLERRLEELSDKQEAFCVYVAEQKRSADAARGLLSTFKQAHDALEQQLLSTSTPPGSPSHDASAMSTNMLRGTAFSPSKLDPEALNFVPHADDAAGDVAERGAGFNPPKREQDVRPEVKNKEPKLNLIKIGSGGEDARAGVDAVVETRETVSRPPIIVPSLKLPGRAAEADGKLVSSREPDSVPMSDGSEMIRVRATVGNSSSATPSEREEAGSTSRSLKSSSRSTTKGSARNAAGSAVAGSMKASESDQKAAEVVVDKPAGATGTLSEVATTTVAPSTAAAGTTTTTTSNNKSPGKKSKKKKNKGGVASASGPGAGSSSGAASSSSSSSSSGPSASSNARAAGLMPPTLNLQTVAGGGGGGDLLVEVDASGGEGGSTPNERSEPATPR